MNRKFTAATLVIAALVLSGCATVFSKHPIGNSAVPQPAKAVDVSRYLGRWYELARYEQGFQKDCDGVTVDYALRSDGKIAVTNRCRKPDGKVSDAKGRAKIVDPTTNAKLKVSFFGPFYGDYWVLDRAPDYSWAIIGEPSGRYLWILGREATPGKPKVDELIGRARALGYDTSMIRITSQP